MMQLGKLLPKKFSTRLFLVTFIAGVVPIVIFAVLVSSYGHRIEKEIAASIENGYRQDMRYSESVLRELGESSVRSKVIEIARQMDLVVQSVPWMTLSDLKNDPRFREMAVQHLGHSGYTSLLDSETAIAYFHSDRRMENKDLSGPFRDLRNFQAIIKASRGGRNASGYYEWKQPDGQIIRKFMYIAPLHAHTADNVRLSVAATIDVDEFTRPIREWRMIHDATRQYLIGASKNVIESLRETGFVFMGLAILVVSFVAFIMGIFLSRAVTKLREATERINHGDFSTPVKSRASGEVGKLVQDFNRMVDQLANTTVSKQLLEESEARLKEANTDLRREIGERRQTEAELAAEKERLMVTLRSIGDGVITADKEGRVVLMNSIAESLTGWRQEEACGQPMADVFRTLNESFYDPLAHGEKLQPGEGTGGTRFNQKILQSKDGAERFVAETSAPISDPEGGTLGTIMVFRDITAERKLEEELLKARKLESLGILAGGIAHDFNNLLAVILGNISFARMFTSASDKVVARLVEAEKSCMRGKDLTYQLLAFARGGEVFRRTIAPREVVEQAVKSSMVQSGTECLLSFPDDLPLIEIDEEQIRQVVERMVSNACEAMENRGVVMVSGDTVLIEHGNPLPVKEGTYVRISIEDQGPGIGENDRHRIFDPYFTTKQMDHQKGTGLGLSICYSIVKDHGGLITVESEAGKGSIFHIYLPAAREPAVEEYEPRLPAGAKGKLLFMDDEEGVREVIGQLLIHLGYDVQFAENGEQAIAGYREAMKTGKRFDVVIADLTVPGGMGGRELISELHRIDPQVRAVISSGYSNDPVLHEFRDHGFLGMVAKPYKIEELCTLLDTIMREDHLIFS